MARLVCTTRALAAKEASLPLFPLHTSRENETRPLPSVKSGIVCISLVYLQEFISVRVLPERQNQ